MEMILVILAGICMLASVLMIPVSLVLMVKFVIKLIKDAPEAEVYKSGFFMFGSMVLGSGLHTWAGWLLSLAG